MSFQSSFIPNDFQAVVQQYPVTMDPMQMVQPQRSYTCPVSSYVATIQQPLLSPQQHSRSAFSITPSFYNQQLQVAPLQFVIETPQIIVLEPMSLMPTPPCESAAQQVTSVQQKVFSQKEQSSEQSPVSATHTIQKTEHIETASSTSAMSSSTAVASSAPTVEEKAILKKLYISDCSRSRITDDLEPYFRYSPNLATISFAKTQISDKGIETFLEMVRKGSTIGSCVLYPSELEYLVLSDTKVTIAGVQNILENSSLFPDLQRLYLVGLNITKEHIEELLKTAKFPKRLSSFVHIVEDFLVIHLDNNEMMTIDKACLFS